MERSLVTFVDQFSPPEVFDFVNHLHQNDLQNKMLLVKSKIDEYVTPLIIADGLTDAAQTVSRSIQQPIKMYPIALPQFIRSLKGRMAEDALKAAVAPERSRVSFAPNESGTDMMRTDVNQALVHKDYNISEPVCPAEHLNQLNNLEDMVYNHLN